MIPFVTIADATLRDLLTILWSAVEEGKEITALVREVDAEVKARSRGDGSFAQAPDLRKPCRDCGALGRLLLVDGLYISSCPRCSYSVIVGEA